MVQYFTKEGLQRLKDELKELKTVENKKIVKLIAEAAAFGDLKENSAYHDARDKMAWLRQRVAELEGAINEAVVKEKDQESNKVQVGSKIIILFGSGTEEYEIVAPGEADILKNRLSYQSPLGQKLIGKESGDEFEFPAPGGSASGGDFRGTKIKILEIK